MQQITAHDALRMLEEAFAVDAGSLAPTIARRDLPGWDSMGTLLLIAELDSRFGIILTPEQSNTMSRVSDVLDLLRAHGCLVDLQPER
jgi:acyl carrier protein